MTANPFDLPASDPPEVVETPLGKCLRECAEYVDSTFAWTGDMADLVAVGRVDGEWQFAVTYFDSWREMDRDDDDDRTG